MNRFSLYALFAVAALGTGTALTGCDAVSSSHEAAAVAAPAVFDGETLFRGVAFGQGPVAELLPEVWETPDMKTALSTVGPDQQQRIDALVARIRADQPGLFPRMSADMHSGDVRRVLNSLDEVAASIQRQSEPRTTSADEEIVLDIVIPWFPYCGLVLPCWPVLWIAEAGNLDGQKALAREELALRLTQRLSASPTPASR